MNTIVRARVTPTEDGKVRVALWIRREDGYLMFIESHPVSKTEVGERVHFAANQLDLSRYPADNPQAVIALGTF